MAFPDGWVYSRLITIADDQVDANLTDYPFLVWVDADAGLGASARADGYDVRFTLDGSTVPLAYERVSWSVAGGLATARWWVVVPSILAVGGATLRIWYGNPTAADGSTAYWVDVPNYSFESWNDPPTIADSWWRYTGPDYEQGAGLLGSFSLKASRLLSAHQNTIIRNASVHIARGAAWWQGKTVSFGAWCYRENEAAPALLGRIYENNWGGNTGTTLAVAGAWDFVYGTRTFGASITSVVFTLWGTTRDGHGLFDLALINGEEWSAAWIKLHKANVLSADHEQNWGGVHVLGSAFRLSMSPGQIAAALGIKGAFGTTRLSFSPGTISLSNGVKRLFPYVDLADHLRQRREREPIMLLDDRDTIVFINQESVKRKGY